MNNYNRYQDEYDRRYRQSMPVYEGQYYEKPPVQYRQVPHTEYKPSTQDAVMSQRPVDLDTKSMDAETLLDTMYPRDLTLKFSDNFIEAVSETGRTSSMHAGWLEPTTDDFFTRITDEPIMVKEGRVQKMTAQVHDIDQFDMNPLFDAERDVTTNESKGLELSAETTPDFKRKELVAVNMVYYTTLTKNFLLGNIKKDGFHQWYYNMMGNKSGNAWMAQGLYSDTSSPEKQPGKGTALKRMDGVLKQAEDIYYDWVSDKDSDPTEASGFAKLGYADNVSDAIDDAIVKYTDQRGASKNAKLILPSNVRMRLAIEIKNNKDTDFASAVYLRGPGEQSTIYGKPLLENEELEKVINGWENLKFGTDGYPDESGTAGTNVVYGYYGDPKNIVWGMLKEAELESSYEHRKRSYLISVALAGDVKINYPQDTIVIPFDLGKKTNN